MQAETFPLYLSDGFPFFCAAAEINSPPVYSDFLPAPQPRSEVMGTGLGIICFIELRM